ncbi:SDR family NAD(P)-dependent oxidoreductase [Nocardia sp. NPDC051052]|uniref:SDR family NAD(P)-dependent oxidoreductase n=1 Tax=Nocardia sp. NPDC051052 TaxID=3364322 RepID=UPI0037B1D031
MPGDVVLSDVDVGDRNAVAKFAKSAVEHFSGVDILINCAGIAHSGTVASTSDDDFEAVMRADY